MVCPNCKTQGETQQGLSAQSLGLCVAFLPSGTGRTLWNEGLPGKMERPSMVCFGGGSLLPMTCLGGEEFWCLTLSGEQMGRQEAEGQRLLPEAFSLL